MALLDFLKYINGVEIIISRFFKNLEYPIRQSRIIKDWNKDYLKTIYFFGFDKLFSAGCKSTNCSVSNNNSHELLD